MRRARRTGLLAGFTGAACVAALLSPMGAQASPAPTRAVNWTNVDYSNAFTVQHARLSHGMEFAGHPLDVEFDNTGAAWTLGEFGMQVGRSVGSSMSKLAPNVKLYTTASGEWIDWTKPFHSTWGGWSSASELGESVVATPNSVWVSQGGQQGQDLSGNHSLLTRYSTTAPYTSCQIPLPGNDNQVIGLAYDSARDRIWFAESEGDHRHGGGAYSTIGWVKASGLGSRCQNDLDYGGNPTLSAGSNAFLRAAAQSTVDSLACTAAQESSATANCVHHGTSNLGPGATHLNYDAGLDTIWITNWADRKLRRLNPATGQVIATYDAPDSPLPPMGAVAWQIDSDADAVYVNEYNGRRITRFDKAAKTWSSIDIPVGNNVEVHSITRAGQWLWFTVSDEDFNGTAKVGKINLSSWSGSGTVQATMYGGFPQMALSASAPPGNRHSFRGIDVRGNRIAVTDHGDMQTLILTQK